MDEERRDSSDHKVGFKIGDDVDNRDHGSKDEDEIVENVSSDSPEHESASGMTYPLCIVCKSGEAKYQPDSCNCAFTYCKKCAMKCATGGKCKACTTFFGSLKLSGPI
mmetsp:Transcript_11667/g.17678  ORF Transcript_11667/g.17678 Transcript_11667/m.17678 type:complete len:108 (+) Transcript_11667:150-473(+)